MRPFELVKGRTIDLEYPAGAEIVLEGRIPTVKGIHITKSGVNFHCIISMAKGAVGTVRQALMLAFGLDPYFKLVIAVDEDIDI